MKEHSIRCWHCPAGLALPPIRDGEIPVGEIGDLVLKVARRERWGTRVVDGDLRLTCPACQQKNKEHEERTFEPFSEANTCPKCGGKRIETRYCTGNIPDCDVRAFREHLHRTCGECHYDWKQETRDHAPIHSPQAIPVHPGNLAPDRGDPAVPSGTGGIHLSAAPEDQAGDPVPPG